MGCGGGPVDPLHAIDVGELTRSTTSSRVSPVAGVQATVVDDELIALDPRSGQRALLNASAALVFTAFDTERSVGDVVAQLSEETGVPRDDLVGDVIDTVDRLLAQRLLRRDDLHHDVDGDEPDVDVEPVRRGVVVEGDRIWSYESGVRVAAGGSFTVRVEPADVAGDVRGVLGALATVDAPGSDTESIRIDLVTSTDGETAGGDARGATVQMVVDGVAEGPLFSPDESVRRLFDHLDRALSERSGSLLFHAGAVERNGEVVVLLGQSGGGKSTLTAALVQAGWNYLTDELVTVEPGSLRVHPYARPLDLDRVALDTLGIDHPDLTTGAPKDKVLPARFGAGSTGGRLAAMVYLSGRAPGRDPLMADLPDAEAVMALLPLTFAATFASHDALDDLADACRRVRTVQLHRSDLSTMIGVIDDVTGTPLQPVQPV